MVARTPLFVAPTAKSKARVSLRKASTASTDTANAPLDQSTPAIDMKTATTEQYTTPSSPATKVLTQVIDTSAVDPTYLTGKKKDKCPVIVDLFNEPLGKCTRSSVLRSWAEAINAGRCDLIFASEYLYSLVPIGFDTCDMSLGKLGEENICSLLTVS